MRSIKRRMVATLLVIAGLAALGAAPASATHGNLTGGRLSTCFWNYGAVGVDDYNIAYPDAGATYWVAFVRRPAGSTLKIKGTFPHARYSSLITYDSAGQFVDGLADYQIAPDAGSTNPTLSGADRTVAEANRKYTVNVLNARATSDGTATGANLFNQQPKNDEAVRNDLYARPRSPLAEVLPAPTVQLELIVLRVYVPDDGTDLNGNVPMPEPELTLSGSPTPLTGQAACDAMDSQSVQYAATHGGALRLPDPSSLLINQQAYGALRYPDNPAALPVACNVFAPVGCPTATEPFPPILPQQNNLQPGATPLVVLPRTPGSLPATFPAQNPADWRAQYSRRYLLQAWAGDDTPGAETAPLRAGGGGFFPNNHNNYVRTLINRKFGKVIVLRGKLPTSPTSLHGDATMGNWANGGFQNRYTSVCMNESIRTTRVSDCVYDEEIPVDDQGRYTIVVSRTEDRPANAVQACGRAWIKWSENGDGASNPQEGLHVPDALTDDDGGVLQIRNMLPDPSFAEAIQNTHTPGDEEAVMGDYLPSPNYMSQADVQSSGCGFDGFHWPLKNDGSAKWIKGLPLPVSFGLDDAAGQPVTSAVAKLAVAPVTAGVVGTYVPATSAFNLNTADVFRHLVHGEYLYTLKTSSLAKGLWSLRVTFRDGSQKNVKVTLK